MYIFRNPRSLPASLRHAVLAIGNFDGVHRGHFALLTHAKMLAKAQGVPWLVMTFHPHPRRYFTPDAPPFALETFTTRLHHFRDMQADGVVMMRFNAAMASLTATEFVEELLVAQLGISHVVVGEDFCYGKGRAGNVEMLQQRAALHDIGCTILPAVTMGEGAVSSSAIRAFLTQGNMEEVAQLLGRPYAVQGRVQHGDKRGRTLGTPTANLALHGLHVPRYGVYVARLWHEGKSVPAVANIGVRPTFGEQSAPQLEVHSLQPVPPLYGQKIKVELLHFLRPEQRFDDSNALQAQIKRDIAETHGYFNREKYDD